MLTNLACPIRRLKGEWDYITVQRLHHIQTQNHGTEGRKDAFEDNEWIIVQCATFSKSLNPRNTDKSVSDIRIRNRFPFESSFWISVSGCKRTILPDIQPTNRIVIISGEHTVATSGLTIWTSTYGLEPGLYNRLLIELSGWAQTVHMFTQRFT